MIYIVHLKIFTHIKRFGHTLFIARLIIDMINLPQTGQHCPSGVMVPGDDSSQGGKGQGMVYVYSTISSRDIIMSHIEPYSTRIWNW